MKLYTTENAPNPRIIDMVLHEKGIKIKRKLIDMMGGENRQPAFLAKNPLGQLPALETDEGFVITEVTAISEYLEEYRPDPILVGANAIERGEARMWARRIDLKVLAPMSLAFQSGRGRAFFEKRMKIWPEILPAMEARLADGYAWLNESLAGKTFLCGDRLTYGDIMLYCFMDFFGKFSDPLDPSLTHVIAFYENMGDRKSAKDTAGKLAKK